MVLPFLRATRAHGVVSWGLKRKKPLPRFFSEGCVPQRGTCGAWPVLPRQRSCGWRDETLCSTPLARKGRLLRHFLFFPPFAAEPNRRERVSRLPVGYDWSAAEGAGP
jgi:hypothetical protein